MIMTAEQIAQFVERIKQCELLPELVTIIREIQRVTSREGISQELSGDKAEQHQLLQVAFGKAWYLVHKTGTAHGATHSDS